MILPLGLKHVIGGWPRATIALIVACTLVQIYGDAVAPSRHEVKMQIERLVSEVPIDADAPTLERVAHDIEKIANQLPSYRFGYRTDSGLSYRAVTSAFVHDGWFHLLGNMLFLWLTGAALEDRWGRARFLAFYVAGAVAAVLGFSLTHHGETANLIGASGAVSALMGAFLVYFPRMQIHFVWWFVLRGGRFEAAAYVMLPMWLAEQALYAMIADDSVAYTGHISGFVFGVVVAVIARMIGHASSDAATAQETAGVAKAIARPLARPSKLDRPSVSAQRSPTAVAATPRLEQPKQDKPADPDGGPRFLT